MLGTSNCVERGTSVNTSALCTSARAVPRRDRFYFGSAIVYLLILLGGFARTFFVRPAFTAEPLAPVVGAHGVLLTTWFLLFLAQTWLAGQGNIALHRRLGLAGAALTLAATLVFVPMAIGVWPRGITRAIASGATVDLAALASPARTAIALRDVLYFAAFPVLVACAVAYRKRPEAHKRLMLLATMSLLPAAVNRIFAWPIFDGFPAPIGNLLVMALLVAAPAVHDRLIEGRVHPVSSRVAPVFYLWGVVCGLVVPPLVNAMGLVLLR